MNIKAEVKKYFAVDEFHQLLEQLKHKYIHYDSCIGTIHIEPKTEEEAHKLSLFLARNIKPNKKVTIKISDIQKSLDNSKFEGVTVDELIVMFFPNIKSNKEIKIETNNYIDKELLKYKKLYEKSIVFSLFAHKEASKKIRYFIMNDGLLLENTFKALDKLPIHNGNNEYLSIFASMITGDPHYFDLDTHNSNILVQFICYVFDFTFENNRNIKKNILKQVGILMDEVSNYVITYNLGGDELLDSFKKNLTPLTINLSNIKKISKIKAENDTVLIVENPSFISKIDNTKINYSVIVTSGNSNLVIYELLEKMVGITMYFNGDFDPEGLLIAQNFKNKYPNINFIGYNSQYFDNGLSDNAIHSTRLKKLDGISDCDLIIIKKLLLSHKVSSYQEMNYNVLMRDMDYLLNHSSN